MDREEEVRVKLLRLQCNIDIMTAEHSTAALTTT